MRRTLSVALAVLALVLGAAACGGDDDETAGNGETTTTETTTEGAGAAGRAVFVANCGSCHTLSDAGTTGTVGPELDGRALSVERVEEQVRNGGGAMPPFEDELSDEEIQDVAEYVSQESGG